MTKRLHIRQMRVDDADALHAIYADREAMTWWSHPPHDSVAQTRERLERSLADEDWRAWAVTLAGDDRAIGTLAAHEKRQGRVVEIGYSLARAHWGKGLAREGVSALLDRLFFVEDHRRVFADTDPENTASNRLLETLGFKQEARLRGEWETHLGIRDSLIWGMLANEWRALRTA